MNYYNLLYILWSLVFIIAIIIELHTQQLIGWASAIAAVIAIITHLITTGNPAWIEILVFFVSWLIIWIAFFLTLGQRNSFHNKNDGYLAYIDSQQIADKGNKNIREFGELRINDKIFRFKSTEIIKKGDIIIVKHIKGITMYVEKK